MFNRAFPVHWMFVDSALARGVARAVCAGNVRIDMLPCAVNSFESLLSVETFSILGSLGVGI
jgi:hypothetical protein